MIGMIAAVSANGVIGLDNKLPWNYPADMKNFRALTSPKNFNKSTVIMGRKTFETINRPLPKRRNIVISSTPVAVEGVETFSSIKLALAEHYAPKTGLYRGDEVEDDVWFIGGAGIYEEGMKYVTEIHLTLVPDIIEGAGAIRFPFINPRIFEAQPLQFLPGDESQALRFCLYKRRFDI